MSRLRSAGLLGAIAALATVPDAPAPHPRARKSAGYRGPPSRSRDRFRQVNRAQESARRMRQLERGIIGRFGGRR